VGAPSARGALTTSPPTDRPTAFSAGRALGSRAAAAIADVLELVSAIGSRDGAVEPQLPVVVPGSRTLPLPLTVAIAVDQSGSTASTDPGKESEQACLLACDWLASQSQNTEDGVGLVRFADQAASLPVVRAESARAAFEHEFTHGGSVGGGTRLTPAIVELCQLLPGPRPEHRVAILITDGQVAEHGEELRGLIGRLRVDANAVYLLALDHDGVWTKSTKARYRDLGITGLIPITKLSRGRLANAIATLLAHEAGLKTG
jgi:Mg-chelatase subunit ChlD